MKQFLTLILLIIQWFTDSNDGVIHLQVIWIFYKLFIHVF